MITAMEILIGLEDFLPVLVTIIALAVIYIISETTIRIMKKRFLQKAKTKKQVTNIEFFFSLIKYIIIIFLIALAVSTYSGSWQGLGLGIGLFSAAIGFALQKPITGIAAWIMMITKRSFQIGDRIIIGEMKGDVIDITLTHIYLSEVGGLAGGEENSRRVIMIPNSVLFEQNIINYSTSQDETILNQVTAAITYESNLDKAMEIALNAAKKHAGEFITKPKREPYTRVSFDASGLNVRVRYFVPVKRVQEFSHKITKEIYEEIKKTEDIEFAYPHTEIVFKDKNFMKPQ